MCCFMYFSGTTLNYFLDNRINKAEILFASVACFLVAVILGSLSMPPMLPITRRNSMPPTNLGG